MSISFLFFKKMHFFLEIWLLFCKNCHGKLVHVFWPWCWSFASFSCSCWIYLIIQVQKWKIPPLPRPYLFSIRLIGIWKCCIVAASRQSVCCCWKKTSAAAEKITQVQTQGHIGVQDHPRPIKSQRQLLKLGVSAAHLLPSYFSAEGRRLKIVETPLVPQDGRHTFSADSALVRVRVNTDQRPELGSE